ncbi:hypothetical protein N9L19_01385 [bacterium]|nr:hypothetical protein [bacterium]
MLALCNCTNSLYDAFYKFVVDMRGAGDKTVEWVGDGDAEDMWWERAVAEFISEFLHVHAMKAGVDGDRALALFVKRGGKVDKSIKVMLEEFDDIDQDPVWHAIRDHVVTFCRAEAGERFEGSRTAFLGALSPRVLGVGLPSGRRCGAGDNSEVGSR